MMSLASENYFGNNVKDNLPLLNHVLNAFSAFEQTGGWIVGEKFMELFGNGKVDAS